MSRGIRIAAAIVGIVAVVSIGAFFYMTREIAAPSQAVLDSVQPLQTSGEISGEVVFRIAQDDSQVSYTLDEVLNGADKTVVGTSSQVAGDILLNMSDLSQAEIGEISINARTFETDSDRRDNAVARFILQSESDANEFITFKPTRISGLPDTASLGDTLNFQVAGDLTVIGTTKEVTFDVTATLETVDQLTGHAETTIQRSDFGLTIPNVPSVTNVSESVKLAIDFVANPVSEVEG